MQFLVLSGTQPEQHLGSIIAIIDYIICQPSGTGMTKPPMEVLIQVLRQNGLVRFVEHFESLFPTTHLKDLIVDEIGPGREIVINNHRVINFGSDSFLGLDQDPRVTEAVRRGIDRWGTHNGASRAFSSVRANEEAENKLAEWLNIEAVLIYPSVTLANMGAIPGLVGRQDLLVVDEQAHNSIQEGAKIAKANGVRVSFFSHCNPADLVRVLREAGSYRTALVAIDGVYSMSGALPPLAELNRVALANSAVLYIDDAHGTGVLGKKGRGTVLDALGDYKNTFVIGSLSKGFSCAGGFIGCPSAVKPLLKMRSNTYIFGGPVVPPYLEAVCTVCDILMSNEYELIIARLNRNLSLLTKGLNDIGLAVLGGQTPIVSVLVGDEADTLNAGMFLFEKGFYVQSVTFPAVPYHAGVLRIQVNANHTTQSVKALVKAFDELKNRIALPGPEQLSRQAA
ncbi:MAG TPA: pyridoxal phosphate-dependent aminotransferase family protein [Gemmataceae bacterium]|jgi:7-keto-8-aminopelargonate synthetase-like enzyme|nr:pyridoxal phosphate-dependent aminotransferase family protein [Gemmataceae bacterium]